MSSETNYEKAERLMLTAAAAAQANAAEAILLDAETYRQSPAHQTAGLTRATLALADEMAAASAIDRERLAAAQVANREARVANVIAFYSTPEQMFPTGVRDQIAKALGITTVPESSPVEEVTPVAERTATVTQLRAAVPDFDSHEPPAVDADLFD